MKEKDYNKWLESKSEIEQFDELGENIKKMIYKTEKESSLNKEVELCRINTEEHEIIFEWAGFEKELARVAEISDKEPEDLDVKLDVIRRGDYIRQKLKEWSYLFDWTFRFEYNLNEYSENLRETYYNKWLKEKSEIEHFDELEEDVKKTIYLTEINSSSNDQVEFCEINKEEHKIIFEWVGYEKELERVAEENGWKPTDPFVKTLVDDGGCQMMDLMMSESCCDLSDWKFDYFIDYED